MTFNINSTLTVVLVLYSFYFLEDIQVHVHNNMTAQIFVLSKFVMQIFIN